MIQLKYFVRINDINELNIFLEERLRIIIEKIDNIVKLKEELIWEGPAKDALIIKYDDYINNLKKISGRIILILAFLKSYHSNFDEEYQKLKNKYSNILVEEVKL